MPELVIMHPISLHEWYHFNQGPIGNDVIPMLPEKNIGTRYKFQPFFKMAAMQFDLGYIFSSNCHRITFLVSTPMFSGSKNRMKSLLFGHSYMENS